jgi:hypothetical protein
MIHFENHCDAADPMTLPVTTARANWYGVTGYPTVKLDGLMTEIGGEQMPAGCPLMEGIYRTDINTRIANTGGMSPIEITGSFDFAGGNSIVMNAKAKLVDPVTLTSLRATLLIYEDNVTWCCGYGGTSLWQHNTRAIYDQSITLASAGDSVNVSATVALNPAWNTDELHVVAYVQKTSGTKEIYQGAMLNRISGFTMVCARSVASVPSGNGAAFFNATLTNTGTVTDTFTVDPAVDFGTWPTEYFIGSDPTLHTGATDVTLGPAEATDIVIRVRTDATKEVRTGSFQTTSNHTLMQRANSLRVYNKSYSVLLVDDDAGLAYEPPLENALNALGLLFEKWDIVGAHTNLSPTAAYLSGHDYVIWQTGWRTEAPLTSGDMTALMSYMDQGGRMFLASQSFLNQLGGVPNTFVTDYLGVASWTLDKGYVQMDGVAGDAIGDGISLPLSFSSSLYKRGDDAVPGPTATTDFLAPDGSHTTIRNTMTGGGKSVFMASAFNAISESAADPNNTKTVLGRILTWLQPPVPASTPDGPSSILASRIERVRPNPFSPRTEITFSLTASGASGPVRLEIFDISGRRVAGLAEGTMTPGVYTRDWNGRTDDGTPVGSGVYFARLSTREGTRGEKLIVLK